MGNTELAWLDAEHPEAVTEEEIVEAIREFWIQFSKISDISTSSVTAGAASASDICSSFNVAMAHNPQLRAWLLEVRPPPCVASTDVADISAPSHFKDKRMIKNRLVSDALCAMSDARRRTLLKNILTNYMSVNISHHGEDYDATTAQEFFRVMYQQLMDGKVCSSLNKKVSMRHMWFPFPPAAYIAHEDTMRTFIPH